MEMRATRVDRSLEMKLTEAKDEKEETEEYIIVHVKQFPTG